MTQITSLFDDEDGDELVVEFELMAEVEEGGEGDFEWVHLALSFRSFSKQVLAYSTTLAMKHVHERLCCLALAWR